MAFSLTSLQLPSPVLREHTGPLTRRLLREAGGRGLGQVPVAVKPEIVVTSVCGFCSTGCGLSVHLRDSQAVNLSADGAYPVNLGMACPKGWESLAPLAAADRATVPLLRDRTAGTTTPLTWHAAAEHFSRRFKAVQAAHGADSVAFISTGQICSEEMALLGAFAKFGMGVVHGDGNTRQCMATAVTAYKQSFGFDAPPATYADFEESDVIVFIGANPCIAHPIMWQRVMASRREPEVIVIDPRRTETALAATWHVPLQPKSDLALFYGLARILITQGWLDHNYVALHTNGFEDFAEFLEPFTPEATAAATGLPVEEIHRLAAALKPGRRVSFWWTMGVNQGHEATRTAQAIINLALMGGHIGKPGTGANSITGQCNAMGSRLFSNTTNLFCGRDFANPSHRAEVAGLLEIPESAIPDQPSLAYDQIIDGIETGKIRGLWVIATNPAHSWIQQGRMRELLAKLDFLVVQDMYHTTETAQLADLVLPAAGWGEKEGTFVNSERRIGRTRQVSRAPGQALSDFRIFRLLADAWGCGPLLRQWTDPEAVFRLLQRLSAGRPCDITGIAGYDMLDRCGGVQWPWAGTGEPESERRLFSGGKFFHADGRARFIFDAPRPVPEPVDAEFPLVLLTGRGTSAQWHTQTRTGKSEILRRLHPPDLYVEVHPADAARLGLAPHSAALVASRRGSLRARVVVSPGVQPGSVFLPMHYEATNGLTLWAVDPHSRQPSYKHCAVNLSPAT